MSNWPLNKIRVIPFKFISTSSNLNSLWLWHQSNPILYLLNLTVVPFTMWWDLYLKLNQQVLSSLKVMIKCRRIHWLELWRTYEPRLTKHKLKLQLDLIRPWRLALGRLMFKSCAYWWNDPIFCFRSYALIWSFENILVRMLEI